MGLFGNVVSAITTRGYLLILNCKTLHILFDINRGEKYLICTGLGYSTM